jgi:hypothetical protein
MSGTPRRCLQEEHDAGAPPPPDPKILGFHPEPVEDREQPHDAFRKGAASTDVAVVAQRARVSPRQSSPPATYGTASPKQHRTTTPTHGSPVPRRPHDHSHRPAPEPLARPPTSKAPTFQGRRPGVPTLRTGELEEPRVATGEQRTTLACHRTKPPPKPDEDSTGQIDDLQPPGCRRQQIWGEEVDGLERARGPCPGPSSRRADLQPPCQSRLWNPPCRTCRALRRCRPGSRRCRTGLRDLRPPPVRRPPSSRRPKQRPRQWSRRRPERARTS